MKNMRSVLPTLMFAGFFIFSCNAGDRSPSEAKRSNDYSGTQAMADSVSSSVNAASPYAEKQSKEQENAGAVSKAKNGPDGKTVALDGSIAGQTEINNNDYQNFIYMMRSTAARPTRLDSTHRFIRTAEIKFRANNVAVSSYQIEDIAAKFGGYVADTRLASNLQSSNETPVSADSSLQTMRFVVTNTIVIRVPVENLDSTLKSLVPMIDYLDYRNVNTNDITLDMFANQLAQKRIAKFNARMALNIDNKGKKLDDMQAAEQSMLQQQENSDNALIENLRKDDQVKYSTVTIYIYQKETIRQELITREKDIDAYEPGLGRKLAQSLNSGWHGLQAVIMVIVILWPLWLIAIGTWFFVRWLLKRNKNLKS